jgi:hypothetical protein
MGIHVDDIAIAFADGMKINEAGTVYEPQWEGMKRDEPLVLYCTGRDWFRHFKVTIEVVDAHEVGDHVDFQEWFKASYR